MKSCLMSTHDQDTHELTMLALCCLNLLKNHSSKHLLTDGAGASQIYPIPGEFVTVENC